MSYSSKIQSAKTIIENHNQNATKKVDFEEFRQKLEEMGGTTEGTLSQCKWEDLERLGVPTLIAREIAKAFRQSDLGDVGPSAYVSPKKAEMMTVSELLERYDPSDVENAVGQRLLKTSRGKKCIVFLPDGRVNVEKSNSLFTDIKKGYPEQTIVQVNGIPAQVYCVGENPSAYAEENPLYPGQPLRSDGTCGQTLREWTSVPLAVRQLFSIARTQTGELKIDSIDDAHDAIDLAISDQAEKKIRQRYKNASVLFDQMQREGTLPLLRIPLSRTDGRPNDPFFKSHVRY